ncbi:hypothetical protein T4B_6498 [Trichinella pseudospiralis]|uniref:Uncharacterized protein n=1 Tax=Trichinella pseudospiralis TaxID=6337 RepID=A0A0V1HJ23_TRIPS|nr:hypothetical protein T4B_6498 [Trichinella pseudospiralis]
MLEVNYVSIRVSVLKMCSYRKIVPIGRQQKSVSGHVHGQLVRFQKTSRPNFMRALQHDTDFQTGERMKICSSSATESIVQLTGDSVENKGRENGGPVVYQPRFWIIRW